MNEKVASGGTEDGLPTTIQLPLTLEKDELWVYTVEEAALLLRIGRSAAYQAIRKGQIPALRLGRRLRVPHKALKELLSRNGAITATTDDL